MKNKNKKKKTNENINVPYLFFIFFGICQLYFRMSFFTLNFEIYTLDSLNSFLNFDFGTPGFFLSWFKIEFQINETAFSEIYHSRSTHLRSLLPLSRYPFINCLSLYFSESFPKGKGGLVDRLK